MFILSYCHIFPVFFWIFKAVWTISCPKSAKNDLFLPKKWCKWKISEEFFFSSPHVLEDKWHSQKKWIFRFSLGGYPEMCAIAYIWPAAQSWFARWMAPRSNQFATLMIASTSSRMMSPKKIQRLLLNFC